MFARVSEITAPADRIDDGIAQFRDSVLPSLKGMEGFSRAYLLVDRANGKATSITVWETEDAMRRSEEAAGELRGQVTTTIGGQSSVGRYEVAVSDPEG